jgi:H+/gluconate symporter-like permease
MNKLIVLKGINTNKSSLKGTELGFVQFLVPIATVVGTAFGIGQGIFSIVQANKQAKTQEQLAKQQLEYNKQLQEKQLEMFGKIGIILIVAIVIIFLLKPKNKTKE